MPRQYSLVKFVVPEIEQKYYPLKAEATYVFFGEIPNMPAHCVVMDYRTGKFFSGYHTDDFVEIPEDET